MTRTSIAVEYDKESKSGKFWTSKKEWIPIRVIESGGLYVFQFFSIVDNDWVEIDRGKHLPVWFHEPTRGQIVSTCLDTFQMWIFAKLI